MLFVVIGEYSRYPEVEIVCSTSANIFRQKMNVKSPELVPTSPSRSQFADIDLKKKEKMKEHGDTTAKARPHSLKVGDTVLVRQRRANKLTSPYNKHPYTILSR